MNQLIEKVTIGLVVHNEEKNIIACLDSLFQEPSDPRVGELILIDNQSTDATFSLAEKFLSQKANANFQYKIIQLKENNMGKARALVIEKSFYPWVAFIDADCRAPAKWASQLLEALLRAPRAEQVAALGGANILTGHTDHFSVALRKLFAVPWLSFGSEQFKSAAYLKSVSHKPTCNIVYRRDYVAKVGNFSAEMKTACEDLELNARLIRRGYSIYSSPQPEVMHQQWRGLWPWAKKMHSYGFSQWQTLLKAPWIFGKRHVVALLLLPLTITIFFLPKAVVLGVLTFSILGIFGIAGFAAGGRVLQAMVLLVLTPVAYSLGIYHGIWHWMGPREELRQQIAQLKAQGKNLS